MRQRLRAGNKPTSKWPRSGRRRGARKRNPAKAGSQLEHIRGSTCEASSPASGYHVCVSPLFFEHFGGTGYKAIAKASGNETCHGVVHLNGFFVRSQGVIAIRHQAFLFVREGDTRDTLTLNNALGEPTSRAFNRVGRGVTPAALSHHRTKMDDIRTKDRRPPEGCAKQGDCGDQGTNASTARSVSALNCAAVAAWSARVSGFV